MNKKIFIIGGVLILIIIILIISRQSALDEDCESLEESLGVDGSYAFGKDKENCVEE